jgi:hypothetical protein
MRGHTALTIRQVKQYCKDGLGVNRFIPYKSHPFLQIDVKTLVAWIINLSCIIQNRELAFKYINIMIGAGLIADMDEEKNRVILRCLLDCGFEICKGEPLAYASAHKRLCPKCPMINLSWSWQKDDLKSGSDEENGAYRIGLCTRPTFVNPCYICSGAENCGWIVESAACGHHVCLACVTSRGACICSKEFIDFSLSECTIGEQLKLAQ